MKAKQTYRHLVAIFVGALVGFAAIPAHAAYLSLYAFGDSLSDAGNVFTATGGLYPPPPYDGRFSNGPVAVEQLATNLGIAGFRASMLGGTDYAWGGAETGPDIFPPLHYDNYLAYSTSPNLSFLNGTGIENQVAAFSPPVGFDPSTSLFFVWGGPNDLFAALDINPAAAGTAAFNAVSNLRFDIETLLSKGATHFLVPNMPDLGVTPFGLGSSDPAGLTDLSIGFNQLLAQALADLGSTHPGADIREFDSFDFVQEVVKDPGAFGFTNATDPCFVNAEGSMSLCQNPSEYVFWDGVHPTTAADSVLAARFAATVPEPGTVSLFGLGLLGLALSRRRRKRC